METKRTQLAMLLMLTALLLTGSVALIGCKEKSQPSESTDAQEAITAQILQKTCPVMGSAINTSMFTEYKGKKVYFCCAGCEEKFVKEPEKYLAKLPQFNE